MQKFTSYTKALGQQATYSTQKHIILTTCIPDMGSNPAGIQTVSKCP
jgi:hypothetical protein